MGTRRLRLTIWGIAAAAWGTMAYAGHYQFGVQGLFAFGTLGFVAVIYAARLANRWPSAGWKDRLFSLCAIACAGSALVYLGSVWHYWGFHETQAKVRDAAWLQTEFRGNARFEDITISYVDPPRMKGEWLSVTGRVSTETDLAELHALVDDEKKWHVKWDVVLSTE